MFIGNAPVRTLTAAEMRTKRRGAIFKTNSLAFSDRLRARDKTCALEYHQDCLHRLGSHKGAARKFWI
jgi:hypothetical protein